MRNAHVSLRVKLTPVMLWHKDEKGTVEPQPAARIQC